MKTVLGIDPGLSGALVLYRPEEGSVAPAKLTVMDMPTYELKTSGKKRRYLDEATLARWFDVNGAGIGHAYIEDVHSMPNDGAVQAFKFGLNVGLVRGMLAAHFIPTTRVQPQVWKRAVKLTGDKDASRRRASELMPQHSGLWPLKKHDGRAEAALIALYGSAQQ